MPKNIHINEHFYGLNILPLTWFPHYTTQCSTWYSGKEESTSGSSFFVRNTLILKSFPLVCVGGRLSVFNIKNMGALHGWLPLSHIHFKKTLCLLSRYLQFSCQFQKGSMSRVAFHKDIMSCRLFPSSCR